MTNKDYIDLDYRWGAHNYKPIPVTFTRGEGIYLWDVEGNRFLDFLCGYSSTNQGHCHPEIAKVMIEQCTKLTQTSRAFHNDKYGEYCKFLAQTFGYDKVLPMNSGVEACETAIKLARRWGYAVKGVPDNQANVIMAKGNFWGRTITASGASDDPSRYTGFGPFTPGFDLVEYNNLKAMEEKLAADKNIVAVMLEPIQGEAGVLIPHEGYLKGMR